MKQSLVLLVVFGIIIVGLWLACWFGLKCLIPDPDERGHFGDQFGAVNALFTGLAFAGVIATLYAQHMESRRQEKRFQTELAQRQAENTAQEQRFQSELARREADFQKQIRLGALTACAEISKELWQHCERQKLDAKQSEDKPRFEEWAKNAKVRYDETMKAYADLETMRKETQS